MGRESCRRFGSHDCRRFSVRPEQHFTLTPALSRRERVMKVLFLESRPAILRTSQALLDLGDRHAQQHGTAVRAVGMQIHGIQLR